MKNQLRVAVIGGGWAGLVAAVELCAAGAKVTVFEAARQIGGRARRICLDGRNLDNGQHILIGAYRETLRLMRMVGADPERLLMRRPLELYYPADGFRLKLPPLPAPLNLALGLMTARGCTLREKLSAARFMRCLQSENFRLSQDCTVEELLDRHAQKDNLRRFLWEPLCLAALNTPPEIASAQIFANVLRDSLGGRRMDTDLLLPAADLGRVFPDAAAAFLSAQGGEIRLSRRVDAFTASPSGLEIDGERFEHVILATSPQHAIALLDRHNATRSTAATLAAYRHEPIATLYAAYPSEIRLPTPMLGLEGYAPDALGQWVFDRGALGDAPGMLAFVLSADGAWNRIDAARLLTTLHRQLEKALGKKLPPPHWHKLICERRASLACSPDLPRPHAQTLIHGLWLAGDYVCADYPSTLEGAARSGVAAATAIIASARGK